MTLSKQQLAQPRQHGVGSYNKGCRCRFCQWANAERQRKYRAKKKEGANVPTPSV